jgi:hypothetical protein
MASTSTTEPAAGDRVAVRLFQVDFPKSDITELRRRVAATRWPEYETVSDGSQGVPLDLVLDRRNPFRKT